MAGIREKMERNMSGLSSRWKEKRIREEIYKESLKDREPLLDCVSGDWSNRTMIVLDERNSDAQSAIAVQLDKSRHDLSERALKYFFALMVMNK